MQQPDKKLSAAFDKVKTAAPPIVSGHSAGVSPAVIRQIADNKIK